MKPGDIIMTPIDQLIYHAGIYAGHNYIIHYINNEIKQDKINKDDYKIVPLVHNHRHTLQQARKNIGKYSTYNIFTNNCWHFIFECAFNNKNALNWFDVLREKYNLMY